MKDGNDGIHGSTEGWNDGWMDIQIDLDLLRVR